MPMDTDRSEETQTSDETECLSEPEHNLKCDRLSPYSQSTHQPDRQRARSLPVDLHQAASGCPTRKRVQFADTMGMNLANVRHFDISDETCSVSPGPQSHPPLNQQRLVPAFDMPVSLPQFEMKSRRLGVALESVTTTVSAVKGVIRVIPSRARREVGVRYTLNNWQTFSDVLASLRLDEEKVLPWEWFNFIVHAPLGLDTDSSVRFAVYCRTDHGEYWDNNDGQNYAIRIHTT